MEIVYFSLGVVTVLLVLGVVVIVRVGTLVKELKEKVRESERHLDDETREIRLHIKDTLGIVSDIKDVLHRTLDDTARDIYQRIDEVQNLLDKRVDTEMRDVYSQLDSRLDKLDSKIKQKDLLNG
jgi:type II secretory ATPase GspE/PulE/Tfp pilus assembly ATPase PilB-like protein